MSDIRFALRHLLRSPGFAAAAILMLAIAIGANTAMFSILHAVILEPLPFRDPERIVRVWETDQHNASFREGASGPDFEDWKRQQTVFSRIVGTTGRMLNLTERNVEAERISMSGVSHDYFDMLGVAAVAGRSFSAADDRTGAAPVAIISDAFWRRRFGGANVIGRTIALDDKRYTLAGVMPASASLGGAGTDVWLPLTVALAPFNEVRGVHSVFVVGRLKDGVTVRGAQSEMALIAKRLEKQYPDDNVGRGAFVEPLHESMVRDARPRLYMLSVAVVAVLLIACINVAGLMLARGDSRRRELAVRASLGASRARIVRQLLTESAVLAVAGGALGLALAWWAIRVVLVLGPALPRSEAITMSVPVLLFAAGTSILSALLAGVVPAVRTSAVEPAQALATARGLVEGTRTAGRGALVIAEVALAVMLVIGAGLLLKSFSRLIAVDVGLRTENVVTFSFNLPEGKYPMPPRTKYPVWPEATNFYDALIQRASSTPGVASAALGMSHPFETGFTSQMTVVGKPQAAGPRDEVRIRPVSPGYFETLGIPLLRGRATSRDDRSTTPSVVVVNEALADRYFRGENPIGKQISFWATNRTIVGVVRGERFGGPQHETEPALYPPLTQAPMSDLTLVVRSSGAPAATIASVRATMRELDPQIALYDVDLLRTTLDRTLATPRFQAVLLAAFGAIALLLAAIGLYALVSYQVQQRTNEIGVRVALGATKAQIAALILRRAAALAIAGIAIGVGGAFVLARFLEALVFQVSTRDPAIFAAVPLLIGVVALVAAWFPVQRAMKMDPADALHVE